MNDLIGEARKEVIIQLFNEVPFKVKIERNHCYEYFNERRLIEHLSYWYRVNHLQEPQKEVNKNFGAPGTLYPELLPDEYRKRLFY